MRILLLTLYFEPDVAANAVIMTELSQELVRNGHEVTVITSMPHYAGNVLQDEYKSKLIHQEQKGSIKIIRTFLYTSSNKKSFVVRFLNYISFNLISTLVGLLVRKHDVILAPSPPLTVGLSAFIIGLIRRTPYIYNVQDIYPEVVIKLGILKNPLGIAFSKWLELHVYKHAAKVTVLSEGFKQNLLKKEVREKKVVVIPNFVDTDFIKPESKLNGFRSSLELEERFIVLYAGNLGHSQDINTVIESARSLTSHNDIVFLIVGNGSRKPYMEHKTEELGLPNIIFLPFQDREKVPEVYASADVSLVPLKKSIAMDSVPSKAFTIMASGRPIVATIDPESDMWDLIEKSNCGICVPPEDVVGMTNAILSLYSNPELRQKLGENGRQLVETNYTRIIVGKMYNNLLEGVVEKSK